MAKILVISDDGRASAEVVDTALEDEDPWYAFVCDCTRMHVRGEDRTSVIEAAMYHLDHHPVHRPVRPPVVGG